MKPYLLDTCILIDFSRGNPQAGEFMQGLEQQPLISSLVVAELYAGIKKPKERALVGKLVEACCVVELTQTMAEQGGKWRAQYGPSHHVGLIDPLLAATAQEAGAVFATLNLKHFPMLGAKTLLKPYQKVWGICGLPPQ
ncbi:MAG: type II toxin-antitoxin system VapC family toxin [bacterium]|nr:type II toxin-antitoxin system VapC family toxin [bacterium]